MKQHSIVGTLKTVAGLFMVFSVAFYCGATLRFAVADIDNKVVWLLTILIFSCIGIVFACVLYGFAHLIKCVEISQYYLKHIDSLIAHEIKKRELETWEEKF